MMMKRLLLFLLCPGLALPLFAAHPEAGRAFHFAVIDQPALSSTIRLQEEFGRIRYRPLAFVVVNGVRAEDEPCDDALFDERKKLLEESEKPLFLSLSGSDWIGCKNENNEDIRIERLQRVREIFFEEATSFGVPDIPISHQSLAARYRHFPENTLWQYENVLFATLHLPADNNHFLDAAGRNNEFEERLVANRHWLQRIFTLARRDDLSGIVIFSDGNPFATPVAGRRPPRDGFREVRQQMTQLIDRFPGRVLLIHGDAVQQNPTISWRDNLGVIAAGAKWLEIVVDPDSPTLFLTREPSSFKPSR